MPHTDTNISRDALRNYGMQPTRRLDGSRSAKDRGAGPDAGAEREIRTGGTIRIYRDTEERPEEWDLCIPAWWKGRK